MNTPPPIINPDTTPPLTTKKIFVTKLHSAFTKKRVLVSIAIISIVLIVLFFRLPYTLTLSVTPSDSIVIIDQRPYKPGRIFLTPGDHSLKVSKPGYSSKNFKLIAENGKRETITVVLEPSSPIQELETLSSTSKSISWNSNNQLISVSKNTNTLTITDTQGTLIKNITAPNGENLTGINSNQDNTLVKTGITIDDYRNYYALIGDQLIPLPNTSRLAPEQISLRDNNIAFISNKTPSFDPVLYVSNIANDQPTPITAGKIIPYSTPHWVDNNTIALIQILDSSTTHQNNVYLVDVISKSINFLSYLQDAESIAFEENKVAYLHEGSLRVRNLSTSAETVAQNNIQSDSPLVWVDANNLVAIQEDSSDKLLTVVNISDLSTTYSNLLPSSDIVTKISVSPDQSYAAVTNKNGQVFIASLKNN